MKTNNYFKSAMILCILPILLLNTGIPASAASQSTGWSQIGSPNPGSFIADLHGVATDTRGLTPLSPTWQIVPSSNPGKFANVLNAVATVSVGDVWAVGYYRYSDEQSYQGLIEHWNGTSWSVVPGPNKGPSSIYLNAVTAISASDVWAVGSLSTFAQTIIEHWNGTTWNVVPSPSPGPVYNNLSGVAAVSANDVWAVGDYYNSTGDQTLIEHWNGTSWSVVPSHVPGIPGNRLYGVAAISANNVWAVGYYTASTGYAQTLIEQWDGRKWNIVPSPNADTFNNQLFGVAAVSANDVWAVGNYQISTYGYFQTLIEQWNGKKWNVVSSPNPSPGDNFLFGVSAASATGVWAVGTSTNTTGYYHYQTLIERWDGASWSIVPSPNKGLDKSNRLNGVVAVSPSDVWAVGSHNLFQWTLTEHYS